MREPVTREESPWVGVPRPEGELQVKRNASQRASNYPWPPRKHGQRQNDERRAAVEQQPGPAAVVDVRQHVGQSMRSNPDQESPQRTANKPSYSPTDERVGGSGHGPGHRKLPRWLLWGIAIRLLLVPFHHPWDLQTWYNMFVDLANDRSPYETLRSLTYSTRSLWSSVQPRELTSLATRPLFYEYYAYPPLPMLVYYPLAKLYARIAPLDYQFVVQGAVAAHRLPIGFMFLFKAPLVLADIGLALLLQRLAGAQSARTFFLNPFVILVSVAWTIESLMSAWALAALFLILNRRYALAGVSLALGALTKWTPGVLWPTLGLWLAHQRAPWRGHVAFHAAFLLTLLAGLIPFWDGVLLAAQFHALRPGANLTPHILLYILAQFKPGEVEWYYRVFSPYVGAITLPLALAWAYGVQLRQPMPLATTACLTVTAFLLGSKIVNEPYVFLLLPLLLWEAAERPSEPKRLLFKIGYSLPLAYAMLNVPILMFALPLYLAVVRHVPPYPYGLDRALPLESHAVILALLAFAFVGYLVYTCRLLAKGGST